MKFVMDASAAAALLLPDEDSLKIDSIIKKLDAKSEIWISSLFWFEFGNIFLNSLNRKRIDMSYVQDSEKLLSSLPIHTDSSEGITYMRKLIQFSMENKLTAYDTSYLELAVRKKISIVTLDNDIKKASQKLGVKVLN